MVSYTAVGPDHIVRDDQGIVLTFSRVHEAHEDISGMLLVSLDGFPGRPNGDISDSRILLTGTRSQGDTAKACQVRVGEYEDWAGLIAKACQLVRRQIAEGSPILNLAEHEAAPDAPYALWPLWREQENVVLFGAGGTAKSTLALLCAALVTTGRAEWGLRPTLGKVLYVDYEDNADNQWRRLRGISSGLGLTQMPAVLYKRADVSLAGMAESLSRQVAREHITGIIVDSAGLACGADPEKSESAIAYFRALRELNVTWALTVAHQPKAKENQTMPFGSVVWWNTPRTIWQTRLSRQEGAKTVHVGLWHRKTNNGQMERPQGFTVTWDQGHVTVGREEVRNIAEFSEHVSYRDQILGVLTREGMLDRASILELTRIKEISLDRTLKRLVSEGAISKSGYGNYELSRMRADEI